MERQFIEQAKDLYKNDYTQESMIYLLKEAGADPEQIPDILGRAGRYSTSSEGRIRILLLPTDDQDPLRKRLVASGISATTISSFEPTFP